MPKTSHSVEVNYINEQTGKLVSENYQSIKDCAKHYNVYPSLIQKIAQEGSVKNEHWKYVFPNNFTCSIHLDHWVETMKDRYERRERWTCDICHTSILLSCKGPHLLTTKHNNNVHKLELEKMIK